MTTGAELPLSFHRIYGGTYESSPPGYYARFIGHGMLRPWQLFVGGYEIRRYESLTSATAAARRHKAMHA